MAGVTCEDGKYGGTTGFTNLGDGINQWWVHNTCGKPTAAWLQARGDDVLNLFRGGPLDGHAYQTSTLLESNAERVEWSKQISEYRWTPEVAVSEKTGASARVWVHHTILPDDLAEQLKRTVSANKTPAAAGTTAGQPGMVNHKEDGLMAENTLEDRRKALKLSRKQVATQSGVSEAKVARIEKEGERTTDEEKATLKAALDTLEQNAATEAAAKAEADAASTSTEAAPDPA